MARSFLSASTEYLQVESTPVTAAPLTISIWFNADNVTDNNTPISIPNSGVSNDFFGIIIRGDIGGDPIQFFAGDGGFDTAETANGYTANTWNHAIAIAASTTDRTCVLNGDTANKGTDTTSVTPAGLNRITVGRLGDSSPISEMDGGLAEAAIWDVALSEAEGVALSRGFSPLLIRPGNLVFYLPMLNDEDNDLVGGLGLTAFGTPTTEDHSPVIYPYIPRIGISTAAVGTSITPALDIIAITGQAVTLQDEKNLTPDLDTIAIAGFDVTVASTRNIIPATGLIGITGQDVLAATGAAKGTLVDLWMTYLAGQGFTQNGFNSRLRAGFISNAGITTDIALASAMHIYFNQQGIAPGTTQDRMLRFLDTNYPTLTGTLTDKLFLTLQNNEFFV